jgi:hypothetical protein
MMRNQLCFACNVVVHWVAFEVAHAIDIFHLIKFPFHISLHNCVASEAQSTKVTHEIQEVQDRITGLLSNRFCFAGLSRQKQPWCD